MVLHLTDLVNRNTNMENQIYKNLLCFSYYGLYSRLETIKIIQEYNNKGQIPEDCNIDGVIKLKSLIVEDKYNRFSENDEDSSPNPFKNLNDTIKKDAFTNFAYYIAGKEISQKDIFTLEELSSYEENMEYGFFFGFTLPNDKLKELIIRATDNLDKVLNSTRSFEFRGNDFSEYCKRELSTDKTENEIISKLDQYTDGSYIELPGYISFLGWICLYEGCIDLWNLLFSKLKYLPLQGALTYQIRDYYTLNNVITSIGKTDHPYKKVETVLLRSHFLRIIVDNKENLNSNLEDKSLNGELKNICLHLTHEFNDNIDSYIHALLETSVNVCGNNNTLDWIARENARWINNSSKVGVQYYDIVKRLKEQLLNFKTDLNLDDNKILDYPSLCLYCEMAVKDDFHSQKCEKIIEALCKAIFTSDYIPPYSIDRNTLDTLRYIYKTLEKSECDGFNMCQKYYYGFVGYNVDHTKAINYYHRLCVWYSILILSVEETGKLDMLCRATLEIIEKGSYFDLSVEDALVTPLHLGELLVSQAFTDTKDKYEEIIIKKIPNLPIVLRILSGNNGIISDCIKIALKSRLIREWETERSLVKARKDRLLNFYDTYLTQIFGDSL